MPAGGQGKGKKKGHDNPNNPHYEEPPPPGGMVAVAVTADNNRLAVATIATDTGTWGNDGGGGGVSDEPDIVYQGGTAQSRKVSTSVIGRSYTHGSGTDMTAADRKHVLLKVNATNSAALLSRTSPALHVKIGSGSGAYYTYYLFGNDNYPPVGGWQFVPVSPNVSGYRDATTGSPTLTSVLYFSLLGDFSATSKSENLVIDAIDIGRGLKLTGGDGASTDGVFADFVTADEGTTGNRWGYVRTLRGIMFVNGELALGENTSETAVATVFQDSTGQVLVWENGLVETGYHRFKVNAGSALTDIDITGATFDSKGEKDNTAGRGYTTTEDTRLIVECTGTLGNVNFTGCVFKNLQDFITSAGVTILDDCDVQTEALTQNSLTEITNSIIRTTSIANVATLQSPTFGVTSGLHDTDFIQDGAGHAIEISSSGTYNFTRIGFSGYGATASSSAAIYVSAPSGVVTINVTDGDTPTYRTAGATVVINNSVNCTFSGHDTASRLYMEATDTVGSVTDGDELVNAVMSTDPYTYTHNYEGDLTFLFRIRKASASPRYKPVEGTGTITTNGFTLEVVQISDE